MDDHCMDDHGGQWWFNKSLRAVTREAASTVTSLSISAANVSVYIRWRRRVERVMEGLVGLGAYMEEKNIARWSDK